jgi:hypothetical protein
MIKLLNDTYYKDIYGFKMHVICQFTSSAKINYYVAIKSTSNPEQNSNTITPYIKKYIDYYPESSYTSNIIDKNEFDSVVDIGNFNCDKIQFEKGKYYQYKKTNDVIKVIEKYKEHFFIIESAPSTIDINTLKLFNSQFTNIFTMHIVDNNDAIEFDDFVEVPSCVFLASMESGNKLHHSNIVRYIKKMKLNKIRNGI